MTSSAHRPQKTVLITGGGYFLPNQVAKYLLAHNYSVFSVASNHVPHNLLTHRDFTLLEIDLNQPLPSYLPTLDLVCDFSLFKNNQISFHVPQIPQHLTNLISCLPSNSHILIFGPLSTNDLAYERILKINERIAPKLILVGDLYGPSMPLFTENELSGLIAQAVKTDKIILEDEGLRFVYPLYIDDFIGGFEKILIHSQASTHTLASKAKTALSAAYEIQDCACLIFEKEVGLFFKGNPRTTPPSPEILIKKHLDSPQTDFKEGLQKTLSYFQNEGLVEKETAKKPFIPLNFSRPQQTQPSPSLQQKSPAKIVNISTSGSSIPRKKIILFFLLIFALSLAKTGLDIFLANSDIENAQKNLEKADFPNAKNKAISARKALTAASNKTKIFTFPFAPILPDKVKSINNTLESAKQATIGLEYFIEGSENLLSVLRVLTQKDSKENALDLETPASHFKKAYFQTSFAASLSAKSLESSPIKSKVQNINDSTLLLAKASQSAYELTNLVTDLVGGDRKTYLVLLQNNTELRPGGGFIGNYALVEFDKGKLQNILVDDIYTIDGQLKEKIDPPPQLKDKLGTTQFYLRDSNWSPDFSANAQTARDFFKKETGKDIDGVIALDLTFVQQILSKIGPVKLSDYNEEINAENLFERGEYHSEVGFFPGSTQKRDFFKTLTATLSTQLLTNLHNQTNTNIPLLSLLQATKEALDQKHLMFSFDNPNLKAYVSTHNWNRPLPPSDFNPQDDSIETRDYLAISDANLGANKVNRVLDRKISYEMTIGKDADLVGHLKITYTNNSQADTWPGGSYTNYLRVYTPFAAGLLEYKNGDNMDAKEVEVSYQSNFTVFGMYVTVPTKSTKDVNITYRIPKNIKLETTPVYHLYVQKQPGTLSDPFEFRFNLPNYISAKSLNGQEPQNKQNIAVSTDLSVDRQFKIEVVKK